MTTHPEGPLPDKGRREEILARIKKLSELPLVIVSFVLIPLLEGPLLMFAGIALFGALTANLASFFVRADHPRKAADALLLQEIAGLRREVAALRESRS